MELMSRNKPWPKALLAVFGVFLIAGLGISFGEYYGQLMAPFYAEVVNLIQPNFEIGKLELIKRGSESMFELRLIAHRAFPFESFTLPAGVDISGFTLLSHSVLHPILLLCTVILGAIYVHLNLIKLVTVSLLGLFLLEVIDVPFVLVGTIEQLLLQNFAPEKIQESALITWMDVLNNGGRLTLPIFVGMLAILFSKS
jgi:hypothetical protein